MVPKWAMSTGQRAGDDPGEKLNIVASLKLPPERLHAANDLQSLGFDLVFHDPYVSAERTRSAAVPEQREAAVR